jgi:hypothetical protein
MSIGMNKRRKIWLSVGAFMLTGGAAADAAEPARTLGRGEESGFMASTAVRTAINNVWAQGGEGGEGGINLETVADDPAEYAMALQVIAAHYDAGLAAYAGGEREAGAQMFAHGLSEIYAAMDELFKKLGANALGKSLEAAVAAAADNKPLPEVRRHVEAVRTALRDALRRGPQPQSPKRMQAFLVGELLERAAAQYSVALKDPTLEPFLDGLGFTLAAKREAAPMLASLRKSDQQAAAALDNALKLALRAYPGVKRPTRNVVPEQEFLVAASRARLAVSAYR